MKEEKKDKLSGVVKTTPNKRVSTKVKNPMGTSFDAVKVEKAPAPKKRTAPTKKRGDKLSTPTEKNSAPRVKIPKKTQKSQHFLSLSRLWRQLPRQREPWALPRQKVF